MTGAISQKALWDSGAGRCIISYDCHNSLHPKYKTELFPSSVRIRAVNGNFIANKGECDITLKRGGVANLTQTQQRETYTMSPQGTQG